MNVEKTTLEIDQLLRQTAKNLMKSPNGDPNKINAQHVSNVFHNCEPSIEESHAEHEKLGIPYAAPTDLIEVEGVMYSTVFRESSLMGYKPSIVKWLKLLPKNFHKNSGGGWTFLNACNQEDGTQWASFQLSVDQLFMLGMGLGLVKSLFPREMWNMLPGGVPYYVIDLD